VLWYCWPGVKKSIRRVKIEQWGVGVLICLQRDADRLHMVQLMPLHPKTPSSLASFKSRLVLPFWYHFTQVVLEKRPLNGYSSSRPGSSSSNSSSLSRIASFHLKTFGSAILKLQPPYSSSSDSCWQCASHNFHRPLQVKVNCAVRSVGRVLIISLRSLGQSSRGKQPFCRCPYFLIMSIRFDRTPTCDRETDTDRRTQGHDYSTRASIASRG